MYVCVCERELQSRKCHQSLVVDIDQRDRLFAAAHETRDWLFTGNASGNQMIIDVRPGNDVKLLVKCIRSQAFLRAHMCVPASMGMALRLGVERRSYHGITAQCSYRPASFDMGKRKPIVISLSNVHIYLLVH